MVASQIGECRDPEANAIDPRLIERMRGDLHRRTACAELLHLRQLTLHRHRIGGRVFAGHHALGGYADTERTEIGAALTRARQGLCQQPGCCRFAVGARDAADSQGR